MSNIFKNKKKLNKLILIFLLQIFLSKNLYSSNSFVALGHLNPILNDKNILENLFRDINELNPDYIFILGDSGIQDKKIFEFYTNRFSDKIYFVPGNHEYTVTQNKITNCLKNCEYRKKVPTNFFNYNIDFFFTFPLISLVFIKSNNP